MLRSLVGSEMCIRDSYQSQSCRQTRQNDAVQAWRKCGKSNEKQHRWTHALACAGISDSLVLHRAIAGSGLEEVGKSWGIDRWSWFMCWGSTTRGSIWGHRRHGLFLRGRSTWSHRPEEGCCFFRLVLGHLLDHLLHLCRLPSLFCQLLRIKPLLVRSA